ncbi:DUF6344 domain-containing protein [Streptomyces phaeofaciens JCM 4814]|uniref:Secreted protein n=1 Tax=Streptomyces phaeofaciens TaxID=68254 RepID=A0A918HQR8_9ACTN|nr:DUF6344 domain-containing protein [Streptomyces phaeofaciens]GGT95717.1 hypothetical protein GCM10010226_86730 [Streptomyces phaeofaciens]
MTGNRVMKLWTTIVTAFLALFAALGLVTTTAGTAAAQTGPTRTDDESATGAGAATAHTPSRPAPAAWVPPQGRSQPPTMKQRIRAESHGKSPRCRHHSRTETESTETADSSGTPEDSEEPAISATS